MSKPHTGDIKRIKHGPGRITSIHTEIKIAAPPAKVWAIMTDFERLPEWSPGLVRFEGRFEKDAEIIATLKTGIGEGVQNLNAGLFTLNLDGCLAGLVP